MCMRERQRDDGGRMEKRGRKRMLWLKFKLLKYHRASIKTSVLFSFFPGQKEMYKIVNSGQNCKSSQLLMLRFCISKFR